MNSIDSIREALEADPFVCHNALAGIDHRVTDDNPMMTGRCLNCRKLIGYCQRKTQRFGWRTISKVDGKLFGLFGVRRNDRGNY